MPAPPLPDVVPAWLRPLIEELDRCQKAFDALLSVAMERRRIHAVRGSEASKAAFEAASNEAQAACVELEAARVALFGTTDDDPEDEEVDSPESIGDPFPRIGRAAVVKDTPEASSFVEDSLPAAIEMIERHAPAGWFGKESADLFRLSLAPDDEPISIVKGVRLESEQPAGHRLRQALTLARDYLTNDVRYDHFAGALALTQLAQLGRRIDALAAVGGAKGRIDALFSGAETYSIIFELLVASACAAKGRDMAFIEPTNVKSPDLRCRDAFNTVVECKRSSALTNYEIAEEARMRELFRYLRAGAVSRGQFGRFEVSFSVEATSLNVEEVAATCLLQRLAAHPERPLAYPWGSVAFHPLPARMELDDRTQAYSPTMLEQVFDWNTEMPEWDGLVCQIDGARAAAVDHVRSPVGMAWRVEEDTAIAKRSRAPISLFRMAVTQIPPGEFGIVYVAYPEGAREIVADNRSDAFLQRVRNWEHDAAVRVPAIFLARQYPLPTGDGNPSMIESTVKLLNSYEGDRYDWILSEYPSAIFTTRG